MLPHIPQSVTPKKDPGGTKTTKNQSYRPGCRRGLYTWCSQLFVDVHITLKFF